MFMKYAFFSGKLIDANGARGQKNYQCPFCRKRMKLHLSAKGNNFFVHYKHVKNCGGQTTEHKRGKLQIAKFFQSATAQIYIEKYLPLIKQRPDILFGHSVIEYQCSPITTEALHARLKGYERLQLKSFWILGPHYFYRRLRFRYLSCFLRYSKNIGFYLAFWLTTKHCLMVRYFCHTIGKHFSYQEQRFYTYQAYFDFMKTKQIQKPSRSGDWKMELNGLRHDLFRGSKQMVKLQWFLNQKGLNLEGCPSVCFLPVVNPPIFGQYVWVWHVWIIYLVL